MTDIFQQIEEQKFLKQVDFVSTGSRALDYIISGKADGTGGWPRGQIGEISGDPYAGKSYCVARTVGKFQEKFGEEAFVFYDDDEESASSEWMKKLGVKFDHTFLCSSLHPDATRKFTQLIMDIKEGWASSVTASQCFKRLRAICESPALGDRKLMLVVDSIGALSCAYEVEYDGDRVDQGQRAKEIKQAVRLSTEPIANRKALLLVTNHNISGPSKYAGGGKTTASGGGFQFGSTVRVNFSKPAEIKGENKEVEGVRLFVKVMKSRYVPPFSEAELNLYWDKAIPEYDGIVEKLVELGKINQSGGWYSFLDNDKKIRKSDIITMLEAGELEDILEEISI